MFALPQLDDYVHNLVSQLSSLDRSGNFKENKEMALQYGVPQERIKYNEHRVWSESADILLGMLMGGGGVQVRVTQ